MLTDNWSVELPLGAGFKHDITGAGAIAGVGKIGSVKALPITLLAQYRFLEPSARIRPYAEVGVTYAHFYGARGSAALNAINPINPPGGTTLSVDSKWAPTVGVGATFALTGNWFAEAQYSRTFLKTTSHLSTGQSISTKLDPDAIHIGVGMRF
jgi:outer membrane protein